jgi:flagellar hook-associated protein FlgK
LLEFQQAYQASARILQTAKEIVSVSYWGCIKI